MIHCNSSNTNDNGTMSSSSANAQSPGLKTYFKTPEGRFKLQYEKTHPPGFLHYTHGKAVTQATIAHLKEKPAQVSPTPTPSAGSGVRLAATRFLGGENNSRALRFVGGNGSVKGLIGSSRICSLRASSTSFSTPATSNYDGKGTYLIFNVGDTLFISDFNSQDKDPIKSIQVEENSVEEGYLVQVEVSNERKKTPLLLFDFIFLLSLFFCVFLISSFSYLCFSDKT